MGKRHKTLDARKVAGPSQAGNCTAGERQRHIRQAMQRKWAFIYWVMDEKGKWRKGKEQRERQR